MALLVQKFGGTSVADPERLRDVADQVQRTLRRGDRAVVVVSAMGSETDQLLAMAAQVARVRPGRELDMLITAGERKATALLCMALHDRGVPADSFTGSQAGFLTDTNHTNARILELRPERVRETIDAGRVAVVGGSQGVSTERDVTFLGRGGSDTTAVALAAALGADAAELYTDVAGVFTADPRIVADARKLATVSFDEMLEMCACGCPKPAMRAVEFARTHRVRLHVRSAFDWAPGTWVREEDPDMEQAVITGVVPEESEAKVTLTGVPDQPGVAAKVFRRMADLAVNVDMIVQNVSEHGVTDISFTVPHADLERTMGMVGELAGAIGATGVDSDHTIGRVSVIGAGMASNPGVAATVFETLSDAGINIDMISTSAIRISCVVAETDLERAAVALHDAFDLGSA